MQFINPRKPNFEKKILPKKAESFCSKKTRLIKFTTKF